MRGHRMSTAAVMAAALAAALSGCTAPLPRHPWNGPEEAMRILAARAQDVRTFSVRGDVRLTDERGESVEFDAAIVAEPPEKLRLRTWKFGTAVFDLVVRGDGVWLWSTPKAGPRLSPMFASSSAQRTMRDMAKLLTGGSFAAGWTAVSETKGETFEAARALGDGGWRLIASIDKPTLTVRALGVLDPDGRVVQRLELGEYRVVGGQVWPGRIIATGESGTIEIRAREAEFNIELPAGAFTPARQARRLRDAAEPTAGAR